ncbi:MAG: hypothetical protein OEZ43_21405 [Gammaproteobacteria bacterium]|nr:hypothetical protein [Gammaproteobacteria bacterium]
MDVKINYWTFLLIMPFIMSCVENSNSTNDKRILPDVTGSGDVAEVKSVPKIELVSSINEYIDSRDRVSLFGEVTNRGDTDAIFVEVKCSFYDDASILVKEDRSYIVGTNVILSKTGIATNTALRPSEVGVFEIWPFISKNEFSSYNCKYSFDIASDVSTPKAKLAIKGVVNVAEDSLGDLEYLGEVKNTGTKGLIFGQVHFVTRDAADAIVDIDSTYLNGDTVILSSIDSTTETALSVDSVGTFTVNTLLPFTEYGSHDIKFEWDDADIDQGVANKTGQYRSKVSTSSNSKIERYRQRQHKIDLLKKAYVSK